MNSNRAWVLAGLVAVAGLGLFHVACGPDQLTTPSLAPPTQAGPGTPTQAGPGTPSQAGPGAPSQAGPGTGSGAGPGAPSQAGPGTGGCTTNCGDGGNPNQPPSGTPRATPTPRPEATPTPAPSPTATPTPVQTLFSFTSTDVPKLPAPGGVCPNGIPCIRSTIQATGVTGRVVFMRVGYQADFPNASSTSVNLYGQGYPTRDERAGFFYSGDPLSGAGFGSSCTINPRGQFDRSGATTWDDESPMSISAGTSPYDNSYGGNLSPGLSYLAQQLNQNPPDINGVYTLVLDRWTVGGLTTERLNCWTLEIWTVP